MTAINPFGPDAPAHVASEPVFGTCEHCDEKDVELVTDDGQTMCDECHHMGRNTGYTPSGEYYAPEVWAQIQAEGLS